MATKAELSERRLEAFRLRKSGMSVADIAVKFNVALSIAYDDVEKGREEYYDMFPEERATAEKMDLARLDDLTQAYYEQAVSGDINAAKYVLEVLKERASRFGLYAPVKQEVKTQQAVVFGDGYEVL